MLPSLSSTAAARGPLRLPPSASLYRPEPPNAHAHAYAPTAHIMVVKKEATTHDHAVPVQQRPGETSAGVMTTIHAGAGRAKTNSERGKEFRAKRKKYEGELETAVYKLRAHIADLDMRKSVWEKRFLDGRHTQSGSLVQLICEYFTLFRFGLRDPDLRPIAVTGSKRPLLPSTSTGKEAPTLEKVQRQEEFIARTMDSDVLVGEQTGPSASLAQWRMYTIAHDSLRNEPYHITTSGSEENPCVEVHTKIHVRISRDTIRYMFPGALHNEALIQKFLHRDVVYKSVFRFQFTNGNRIAIETADIGIVDGLQDAGFGLEDISQLMQTTVLTPQCMIPEATEHSEPRTPPPSYSSDPRQTSPPSTKLSLNFLLANDELRPDERVH